MKAKIRTDALGNITVHIEGNLDFDNSLPLRKQLKNIQSQNPSSQITLDLYKLDFVGSSGINLFIETIRIINDEKRVRISNAKSEFLKIFKRLGPQILDCIEDDFESNETKFLSQKYANRKQTFEN